MTPEPLELLNSLGIAGPNIIHAEQGMYPDGKNSADGTWDGPGVCVCRREWPCEALALYNLLAANPAPSGLEWSTVQKLPGSHGWHVSRDHGNVWEQCHHATCRAFLEATAARLAPADKALEK